MSFWGMPGAHTRWPKCRAGFRLKKWKWSRVCLPTTRCVMPRLAPMLLPCVVVPLLRVGTPAMQMQSPSHTCLCCLCCLGKLRRALLRILGHAVSASALKIAPPPPEHINRMVLPALMCRLRESMGISADSSQRAFPSVDIDAFSKRIIHSSHDHGGTTGHFVVAVDPSGGGSSQFAICSIAQLRSGTIVVSAKSYQVALLATSRVELKQD